MQFLGRIGNGIVRFMRLKDVLQDIETLGSDDLNGSDGRDAGGSQ